MTAVPVSYEFRGSCYFFMFHCLSPLCCLLNCKLFVAEMPFVHCFLWFGFFFFWMAPSTMRNEVPKLYRNTKQHVYRFFLLYLYEWHFRTFLHRSDKHLPKASVFSLQWVEHCSKYSSSNMCNVNTAQHVIYRYNQLSEQRHEKMTKLWAAIAKESKTIFVTVNGFVKK